MGDLALTGGGRFLCVFKCVWLNFKFFLVGFPTKDD